MKQPIRFLLVEDDADHAELIRQSFSEPPSVNHVEHVASGEDALAYLRREGRFFHRSRPDVVLLDVNLPGMSGLEVLAIMKQEPGIKRIPVVMLTTSMASSDRARAYEHHANSYVIKSVNFERLQEVVQQLERYWTFCNQPPTQEEQ